MAINREKARAAGYTDQEIDAFEAEDAHKVAKPAMETAQVDAMEPPPPQTTVPEVSSTKSTTAVVGGKVAETLGDLAVPAAEIAAGGYGVKRLVVNPITRAIGQMGPNARTVMPNGDVFRGGQPSFNNPGQGVRVGPGGPTPVAPTTTVPTAPPQPPTAQNFIQRMAALAGRYAPMVRGAAGVGAAVMPGNVGQNYGAQFPQTGPMRGMEINPQTGAPWTPQELQQYAQFNQ